MAIKNRSVRTRAFLCALIVCLWAPAAARADFTVYNPPDPQKVDFVVKCFKVKSAYFDPIVYPGQSNVGHKHLFGGNLGVAPNSTPYSLTQSGTNCKMTRNRSAYWVPVHYANGVEVNPGWNGHEFRVYYRAGTTNTASVQPIPFGLRIIAGNAAATSAQSASIAGFQCRDSSGNTVAKQSLPPNCPAGDYMESSVVFPNCWNGTSLDSPDHKSHMAYAQPTVACPSTHPVRLPQLTIAIRWPTDAFRNKTVTLATKGLVANSKYTLHADAMFAWDPAAMRFFVNECIRKNIGCEDISDTRLPPGKTLPPPEWPPAQASSTAAPVMFSDQAKAWGHCVTISKNLGGDA